MRWVRAGASQLLQPPLGGAVHVGARGPQLPGIVGEEFVVERRDEPGAERGRQGGGCLVRLAASDLPGLQVGGGVTGEVVVLLFQLVRRAGDVCHQQHGGLHRREAQPLGEGSGELRTGRCRAVLAVQRGEAREPAGRAHRLEHMGTRELHSCGCQWAVVGEGAVGAYSHSIRWGFVPPPTTTTATDVAVRKTCPWSGL